MRAGDGQKHRVAGHRIHVVERLTNDRAKASRLGMLHEGQQGARRVVLIREHEPIDSLAAGVEKVVGAFGRERDVRDQGQPGKSLLEVPEAFEVGLATSEQIHDCDADRLPLADGEQARPVFARHDLVAVFDRRP